MHEDIKEALEISHKYAEGFLDGGKVSEYIPGLATANPKHLGCAVMHKKECYTIGECDIFFTIQSISKVISLMYALKIFGYDVVFNKVGMEPSGDPFNCFIKLETAGERPFNPFINAGAITVISLLADNIHFNELMRFTCEIFGDDLTIDNDIFSQEMSVGKRNRSMAYLMSSKNAIGENIDLYLDYYFRLCAVNVTAKHLAYMGSILASGGKHPYNGQEILSSQIVRITRAVMLTCGMYDGSGEFAVSVGLPAKSGIGGGIAASSVTSGGSFGIGSFGPALDLKGNSIGGIKILQSLSDRLGLHLF